MYQVPSVSKRKQPKGRRAVNVKQTVPVASSRSHKKDKESIEAVLIRKKKINDDEDVMSSGSSNLEDDVEKEEGEVLRKRGGGGANEASGRFYVTIFRI